MNGIIIVKIISWNINGINSCLKKGLIKFIKNEDADIYCFQETKSSPERVEEEFLHLEEYHQFWFSAEKKGYSGTLVLSKKKPLSVVSGIGIEKFDSEGRVIALEFEEFFMVNVYFPHSRRELERIDFKLEFNNELEKFVQYLGDMKPVIIASDFNVAHKEIDLANPKQNERNAGFTNQEREWFDSFLKLGYIDTFREFNKEGGNYTWWTYRFKSRERNIGWRVDYLIISEELRPKLQSSEILNKVMGSDHAPIRMEMKL
jgi:exodeoxyribonuclease-3